MNNFTYSLKSIFLLICFPLFLQAQLPAGFADQQLVGGFEQGVGLTFDANGRMYVWEKKGKVWIVENGVRFPTPLLDISEEVGNWRDFGMLGLALDPNFLSNGRIYVLYIVDRHHLLYHGSASYNPNADEYFNATIGRITRYTATAASNYTEVDYSSRKVLLGATITDGFPNLHQSHGTGHLVFGTDGTLMASFGDGASYSSKDEGAASETYYQQAIADGIITSAENIGAYRSQLLDNYAGKILRIDPETGAGIPSNPYYQSGNPFSRRSKVWARGLRNPCRFDLRPGTGSHDPSAGDPGVFYVGDVGWGSREELNVVDGPALNFGWPKYEGMTYQPGYSNNNYAPTTHELAKIDWRTGTARASVDGTIYNIGSSQVPGPSFSGNCSIGGVWYTGSNFPATYQNSYFHCDYGGDWIKNFSFDQNNNCTEVKNFKTGADRIVFLTTSPIDGGLYYLAGAQGNSNDINNAVRKISYTGGNLPPVAEAIAAVSFGTSPLLVQFRGNQSFDPDNDPISYSWDFGDGQSSTEVNPSHSFTSSGNSPQTFTVELEVSDGSLSDKITLTISLNNTPPQIQSTSVDNIGTFSNTNGANLNLNATVFDAEHNSNSLTYQWITELHHNEHFHQESPDTDPITNTILSPIGCDGATYWYRIKLIVSDPEGLYSVFHKDIYPDCAGLVQTINFAPVGNKIVGAPDFNLSATASSGLPVVLHIVSGPATISGNTVSLTGAPGELVLRAIQSGNETYAPAIPVEQTIAISQDFGGLGLTGNYYNNIDLTYPVMERLDPVIDFNWGSGSPDPAIASNTFSIRWEGEIQAKYSENYTFHLSSDDGTRLWIDNQLVIDRWVDQAITTTTGNIALSAARKVPIKIEYYENGGAAVAKLEWSSSSQSKEVIPSGFLFPTGTLEDQTINFDPIPDKLTTDQPFIVRPTASSGLKVDLEIVSGKAKTQGDTLLILNGVPGTVTVRAWQKGNEEYHPSPDAIQSFTVVEPGLLDQTVSFDPIPDKITSDAPFIVRPTASSGLKVDLEIVSGPAKTQGDTLVLLNGTVGTVTIRAYQKGNAIYNPSPDAYQDFTIYPSSGLLDQTVTFDPIPDKLATDAPFVVRPLASSGLKVDIEIVSGKAKTQGDTLIILNGVATTVTVRAWQKGNATYNPSADVFQSFTVEASAMQPLSAAELEGEMPELQLTAQRSDDLAALSWTGHPVYEGSFYVIERAGENKKFIAIDTLLHLRNDPVDHFKYTYLDQKPLSGINFYRIKQVLKNGGDTVSEVQKIEFSSIPDQVLLYPNPSRGEVFVQLKSFQGLAGQIGVYNYLGQEMRIMKMGRIPSSPVRIDFGDYANGLYYIRIKAEGRRYLTYKLLLNRLH